ncbi:MAG: HEPN-associated N-terminal domain-containing protein [Lachnospiraceae bacterium]
MICKNVCAGCFGDKYLGNYIRKKGKRGYCSFCKDGDARPARRNVLPLDDVMPVIEKIVDQEYLPALDNVAWDSENEEYMDPVLDPYDFVMDELNQYLECESEELLLELMDRLTFEDRISAEQFITRQEEQDMQEWNQYCELVKKSKLSAEQIITESDRERATPVIKEIRSCLDKIYSYIRELNLTDTVQPSCPLIRCGTHIRADYREYYDIPVIPASLVGTAPPLATSNNRMSEKGDMMFYGAFQEQVAAAEIGAGPDDLVTVGIFHVNRRIRVLDLSTLYRSECPSIFDSENKAKRSKWFFLKEFMYRISEPADSSDPSEYKPTQVFTKYIQRKTEFSGIIYPSSRFAKRETVRSIEAEKCIVLFVANRDCLETGDKMDFSKVQLVMEPDPAQKQGARWNIS